MVEEEQKLVSRSGCSEIKFEIRLQALVCVPRGGVHTRGSTYLSDLMFKHYLHDRATCMCVGEHSSRQAGRADRQPGGGCTEVQRGAQGICKRAAAARSNRRSARTQ